MNIFTILLVNPIINILVAIYQALIHVHIPSALGFSIILLTLAIRGILWPFTHSQIHTSKKMQTLNPHLKKLKEKHKGDNKTLQAETMKLYKEHGVNPAAGCLPALIQLPIIFALYGVLREVVNTNSKTGLENINKVLYFPALHLHTLWDTHFFGLPLGQSPSQLLKTWGFLILLIPVMTAAFQMIQSKMMFAPQDTNKAKEEAQNLTKNTKGQQKSAAAKADKKDTQEEFASAMQTQSLYIIPLVIGYSSFSFPLGLSLYWNSFTIFGIIQQYVIAGWGGMQPWIDKMQFKMQNSKVKITDRN